MTAFHVGGNIKPPFASKDDEIAYLRGLAVAMFHVIIDQASDAPPGTKPRRALKAFDRNLREVGALPMTELAKADIAAWREAAGI